MRLTSVATTAALLLCAVRLDAQRSYGFGMGADIPIGGTADVLKSGYHTTLSFSFKPRAIRHHIRIDGAISELRQRDSLSTPHRIQFFTVDLIASGPSRLTPSGYVVAGFGTYQQTSGGRRTSDGGLNLGAGINFPRAVVGSFIEARLHYIAGDSRTKFFPITFGLVF